MRRALVFAVLMFCACTSREEEVTELRAQQAALEADAQRLGARVSLPYATDEAIDSFADAKFKLDSVRIRIDSLSR